MLTDPAFRDDKKMQRLNGMILGTKVPNFAE